MFSFPPVGKLYCKLHFAQRKSLVTNGRSQNLHTVTTQFRQSFRNSSIVVLQYILLIFFFRRAITDPTTAPAGVQRDVRIIFRPSLQVSCPLWREACVGRCTWASLCVLCLVVCLTGCMVKCGPRASTWRITPGITPSCTSCSAWVCLCSRFSTNRLSKCTQRPNLSIYSIYSTGWKSTWATGSKCERNVTVSR